MVICPTLTRLVRRATLRCKKFISCFLWCREIGSYHFKPTTFLNLSLRSNRVWGITIASVGKNLQGSAQDCILPCLFQFPAIFCSSKAHAKLCSRYDHPYWSFTAEDVASTTKVGIIVLLQRHAIHRFVLLIENCFSVRSWRKCTLLFICNVICTTCHMYAPLSNFDFEFWGQHRLGFP